MLFYFYLVKALIHNSVSIKHSAHGSFASAGSTAVLNNGPVVPSRTFSARRCLWNCFFVHITQKGKWLITTIDSKENRNKRILQKYLPSIQRKGELIHCLERLLDQFVVKQSNLAGKDPAAMQIPLIWCSSLQTYPHPNLGDKRRSWVPCSLTDTTAGWHHFLTPCKSSQMLTELSEQATLTSL